MSSSGLLECCDNNRRLLKRNNLYSSASAHFRGHPESMTMWMFDARSLKCFQDDVPHCMINHMPRKTLLYAGRRCCWGRRWGCCPFMFTNRCSLRSPGPIRLLADGVYRRPLHPDRRQFRMQISYCEDDGSGDWTLYGPSESEPVFGSMGISNAESGRRQNDPTSALSEQDLSTTFWSEHISRNTHLTVILKIIYFSMKLSSSSCLVHTLKTANRSRSFIYSNYSNGNLFQAE